MMMRMAFILRTLLDAQCAQIIILLMDFTSPSRAVLLGITARMVPLVTCKFMLIPTCQDSEVCKIFLCACVRACYNLAGMEHASSAAPLYYQDGSSERTHYVLRDALALHYSIARPDV